MSEPTNEPDPHEAESEATPERVVAIDGPSGAGKGSVARALADRLGYQYLDTGAMSRAVTWHFLKHAIPTDVSDLDLTEVLRDLSVDLRPDGEVRINGIDVTSHIRSHEVESRVSTVSAIPAVRRLMRGLQRRIAVVGPVVAEGRDMASVVFPNARWKFYVDADPPERARRRTADFRNRGREVSESEVLEEILVRDGLDSSRADAPLRRTDGAMYVDTTGMTLAEVIDHLHALVVEDSD